MMMKQLFRQTATLLRTALLFGAVILVNTQTQAQNEEQLAKMPSAFETIEDVTSIIGDGHFYYIQFYDGSDISYLVEHGDGNNLRTKDYIPFATNRQWTLESAGGSSFYLKSARGIYARLDGTNYKGTNSQANATALTYLKRTNSEAGGGYEILVSGSNKSMERRDRAVWADVIDYDNNSNRYPGCRLRIAKLKDNIAHIIYWQEPIYRNGNVNDVVDRNTDTRGGEPGFTQHHYLTNSGTNDNKSAVSSRKSILWYYDAWQLPTAAAYHQDGLWTLESAGPNGEFYIKKYGEEEYLNYDGNSKSVLGTKNADYGKYTLENANTTNRYVRIQNGNKFEVSNLTSDMFKKWNGYGADATYDGEFTVGFNISNNAEIDLGGIVAGDNNVEYHNYADLSGYKKIVIEGTANMQIRFIFNRTEQDGSAQSDANGGSYVLKIAILGDDGKAEVDLSDLPFVHLNAIKNGWSGTKGKISSVKLSKPSSGGSDLFLSCANTDGNPVTQAAGNTASDWYAGFLPVEVPVPNKDEYYQVVMGLKPVAKNQIALTGGNMTVSDQVLSGEKVIGATFTPTAANQNAFQYKPFDTRSYRKIVIKFGSAVPETGDWKLHTYGDTFNNLVNLAGETEVTVDLTPGTQMDDFTILNQSTGSSITISEIYFTPDYPLEMLAHNGYATQYSEEPASRQLWQLEQVDDYTTFRVKDEETGKYLKGFGQMTDPNDPDDAETKNIDQYLNDFYIRWFYVNPAKKEIPVDHYVTHRESYLKSYAEQYKALELDKQGLATEADSEWKTYTGDNSGIAGLEFTQNVNHFEITHYIKQGNTMVVEFPTVLSNRNDHIYFQRFYNYDEKDREMNLDNLKAHVSLDTRDDGDVQYFLYKNGMVTGQKLAWDGIEQGGYARNALRRINFTNSDGQPFTLAVDVSRYSDMTYKNSSSPLDDNLEEPSLTMRYIYYMKDAKEMATNLTACTYGSNKWLEAKTFHFPAKQIAYEKKKEVGYRGEFIGLRHVFSDYWVFDGSGTGNDNLVSAVNDNNGGKIEVKISDPNGTGIRLGGFNPNINLFESGSSAVEGNDADYQGFYFYDKMGGKTSYGDSRFVVFRYPSTGQAAKTGNDKPAYVNVYLNNNGTRYQLAQFTVIFDPDTETKPWKPVTGITSAVQGTERDPKKLREKAGRPIAKITFDYPYPNNNASIDTYHFPSQGTSRHNGGDNCTGTIANSSPVPLTFAKTNYSFDGDNTNWGSYAMVGGKSTVYGKYQLAAPVNDATYGYNIDADPNFKSAFLYIDASEQPGDICSAPFVGNFCSNDKLMVSGWISGSNAAGETDNRCPGGVTMTIKGEDADGNTKTIYRFCPGQCYELDDGDVAGNSFGVAEGDRNKYHVVWQQFYFEFTVNEKYERHWIEVNNNCVSSNGGDFMLDNIEVYTIVPTVDSEINTPLCVKKDGTTEMRLLKLDVDYNRLKSSAPESSGDTPYLGFVFLDKMKFLTTFKSKMGLSEDLSLEQLADDIEKGKYDNIQGNDQKYKDAFDAALLGTKNIWKSTDSNLGANKGAGVMYFQWNKNFESIPQYSFYKAVNKQGATFRGTNKDGEPILILNGNYPELPWRTNVDYYIVPSNSFYDTFGDDIYSAFNICSACTRTDEIKLDPPYTVLGLEKSEGTDDYVVCEGQIPTVALNLKGYDLNGKQVPMTGLNFDWWLGDPTRVKPDDPTEVVTDPTKPSVPRVKATLDNYHSQQKNGVKLDGALAALRSYYPTITSLDGVIEHLDKTPNLSEAQVLYLQEVVKAGQLVLHQSSISVPAERASKDDPYFYLVACPIHDEKFDQALNPQANQYVAFFCDEPQGLRIKVGQKAPTLKTGFVPNENGFAEYNYPDGNPVLSIRLAKKAQFETVKHGETTEAPNDGSSDNSLHYLWLPVRNAEVQSTGSTGVIQKSDDYNVYLASTDDPTWDKEISRSMRQTVSSLPIVGKIVSLTAVNTKGQTNVDQTGNRLCIYFTDNFEVREGYSYTLSLPFKESPGENACDGTILINLKIVPDYEVWTGAADNTDWNNDQNWRRADGNLSASTDEPTAQSPLNSNELYRTGDLPTTSPLKDYVTNTANYRTPLDRILRKGFAPLYCTHILIKSNEWGNAPVLYDALDAESGNANLTASPFPNLRDTSTPILKFDMQARHYELWKDTYGTLPNYNGTTEGPYKGRTGDLIAEMYQINSCDEIAFQPGAELLNAHLLNYNNAWVEYELNNNRWYLLGSPLQGTISGEWYAPTGTAQQKTTYYENVTFGAGYDRYSPAIYQRSWDKAKAVLYEVGSAYSTGDNPNDEDLGNSNTMPGSAQQGQWSGTTWDTTGADEYLDRLGYKPLGGNKVNVAIKGVWSNTYNDATVDYTKGGFSVLVKNDLKGNDTSGGKAIIRLPKEDVTYQYWNFDKNVSGTDTNLSDVRTLNRAKNRGRLKTDLLLPTSTQKTELTASRYGDKRTYTRVPTKEDDLKTLTVGTFTERVAAGISNMGYYLVANPFPCGLDMEKFFEDNTGLEKKYWILTTSGQQLVQKTTAGDWITQTGSPAAFAPAEAKVAPGQGFFVQASTAGSIADITFNKDMQAQTRYGEKDDTGTEIEIVVGTRQVMENKTEEVDGQPVTYMVPKTDDAGQFVTEPIMDKVVFYGYNQSTGVGKEFPLKTRGESAEPMLSGLVITAERGGMQSSALVLQRGEASNDFLPEEDTEVFLNSDLVNAPTVYTLCGRLATTINTIHDFTCLPLGVESSSDAPCTLTFQGVEMLADSVALYDAVEQKLTPLESGMTVKVSGQTQNRYYLLGGMPTAIEAAEATHLQIFTEGRTATVIASTTEPLLNVRCYDMAGQLVYSASPQSAEHSFSLPIAGVYIIDAQTEHDRKTMKVVVR